jgi:hypothetical protein
MPIKYKFNGIRNLDYSKYQQTQVYMFSDVLRSIGTCIDIDDERPSLYKMDDESHAHLPS